jgi:DNA-binding transcriptional regulator YiaG
MKYKSEICEVMHQDAMADFKVGAISEKEMRKYDKMCLVKEPKAPYKIEKTSKIEYAMHVKMVSDTQA